MLTFSFYPGKNLGAYGDAGAVITNDAELDRRMRMMANHGRMTKFDHEFEAYNSRMDGLQGAILNAKLPHLDAWIERRRGKRRSLQQAARRCARRGTCRWRRPACATSTTCTSCASSGARSFQAYLKERDIATGIHYPVALHNLTAYKYLGHKPNDFPVANRHQDEIVSLPMYPELTAEMIEYVVEAIKEFQAKG